VIHFIIHKNECGIVQLTVRPSPLSYGLNNVRCRRHAPLSLTIVLARRPISCVIMRNQRKGSGYSLHRNQAQAGRQQNRYRILHPRQMKSDTTERIIIYRKIRLPNALAYTWSRFVHHAIIMVMHV